MSRLDKDDFVPHAPANAGEEVHVHHCKQGRNNDRLYIRRNDDGSIIAYCHHCGLSGYHNPVRGRLSDLVRRYHQGDGEQQHGTLTLPRDTIMDIKRWPIPAQRWVKQYGLTDEEIRDAHIGYSFYRGRVIIPTYGKDGRLLSWQGREISDLTDKSPHEQSLKAEGKRNSIPKYDTKNAKGTKKSDILEAIIPKRISNDTSPLVCFVPQVLVITEDRLSAIKCARFHDAVSLNGSSVKARDLTNLAKYGIIYVFLDNDNNEVKKSQLRLKKSLELIGPKVTIVHADKDPKEHTMKELEELLT